MSYPRILALLLVSSVAAFAQSPLIANISPSSGAENSRVEINGANLEGATTVLFGATEAAFKSISPTRLVALVPHKTISSTLTVVTPRGRASSEAPFLTVNDPRIPEEVSYKGGYVNRSPIPPDFRSAMLWGIAIADTRVSGYQNARVKISHSQLTCHVGGKDIVLNDDSGAVRGGFYRRNPWFGTDQHAPMEIPYDAKDQASVMEVGSRPDVVWHFWSASPRAIFPAGQVEGCKVTMRVKISPGALLQVGMDYWRNSTVPYGPGGNNHEAGASRWYFPSDRGVNDWQEATFTDIGGPQF